MKKLSILLLTAILVSAAGGALVAQASPPAAPPARPMAAMADDLLVYYKLNETSGNRYSAFPNDVSVHLGSYVSYDPGILGNAASITAASSQYLGQSNTTYNTPQADTPWFLSFWIKFDSLPSSTDWVLVAKGQNNNISYRLNLLPTHYFRFMKSDDGSDAHLVNVTDSSTEVFFDTWYFVSAWYDPANDEIALQVNDNLAVTASTATGIYAGNGMFVIGGQPTGTTPPVDYHLNGSVDEFGIWERVLTEEERGQLYNGGLGCTYPFANCGANELVSTVGDATIREDNPTTNYGTDDELWVGDSTSGGSLNAVRSVINFDWNEIPPGSQIITATLRLTGYCSFGCGSRTIDLSTLTQSFSEPSVSWNNAGGVFFPWATAGAGGSSRRAVSASFVASSTLPEPYDVDVTGDVQKFVSGEYGGYGWVLQDHAETNGQLYIFVSGEGAVPSYRPTLLINYVPPPRDDANWLSDGSFEKSPLTSEWVVNSNPAGTRQVNENVLGDFYNIGDAYCGQYYYTIDGAGITQRFYWPGGTAYLTARVRAQNTAGAFPLIEARRAIGGGLTYPITFIDGTYVPWSNQGWQTVQASIPMFSGYYDMVISDGAGAGDGQADFQVDDVTIALNSYMSLCLTEGGPTITPYPSFTVTSTRTTTPTPTGTIAPTGSPTITPSPTPGALSGFSNCSFELGSAGWLGGFSVPLAGGPVGPQYATAGSGQSISQTFNWPGGTGYFTFWVGPDANGAIRARRSGGASFTLWSGAAGGSWALRTASWNDMPAGTYVFEALPNSGASIAIDGAMVAQNGYAYCNSGSVASTPTPGPTSFVTATVTRTPTSGPSPTAQPSATPPPTRTPFPTNTPQPTFTPQPTSTAVPTNTQTGPEQTATAQGTTVPTYTPYPTYTPAPTGTPVVAPPQQPEAGCNADCIRPQGVYVINPGAWIEYVSCRTSSWVTWCPENTAQVKSWTVIASEREPWGTVNEVVQAMTLTQIIMNSFAWDSTGGGCNNLVVNIGSVFGAAQGILAGNFQLQPGSITIQGSCSYLLAAAVGPGITSGICGLRSLLCATGIMPWIQWLTDTGLLIMFAMYFKNNWIAKATES